MTLSALSYVPPVLAAAMHTVSSLIVVFNSARLVRKGEELEHYQPEPAQPPHGEGGSRHDAAGQLVPKVA
jgi:hypothetical protein